jgi:hypothetical protein
VSILPNWAKNKQRYSTEPVIACKNKVFENCEDSHGSA